jgi:hypothetical protein
MHGTPVARPESVEGSRRFCETWEQHNCQTKPKPSAIGTRDSGLATQNYPANCFNISFPSFCASPKNF